MEPIDWLGFLQDYNTGVLVSHFLKGALAYGGNDDLARAAQAGWLGYPGATEEQLTRTEERLGSTLPPGYRAFLQVSNGWRAPNSFVPRLHSAEELEWFRNTDDGQQLIEIYREIAEDHISGEGGWMQEALLEPVRAMERALLISEIGRGGGELYLLIPVPTNPEAEWEAWFYGSWVPGYRQYGSFRELMQQERELFIYSEREEDRRQKLGPQQYQQEQTERWTNQALGKFLAGLEERAHWAEEWLQKEKERPPHTLMHGGVVVHLGLANEMPGQVPQTPRYERTQQELQTLRVVIERVRHLQQESRSVDELLSALRTFRQNLEQQGGACKLWGDELGLRMGGLLEDDSSS